MSSTDNPSPGRLRSVQGGQTLPARRSTSAGNDALASSNINPMTRRVPVKFSRSSGETLSAPIKAQSPPVDASVSSDVGLHRKRGRSTIARFPTRSEEHTSELQSLMRISYAVFCLKKKKNIQKYT